MTEQPKGVELVVGRPSAHKAAGTAGTAAVIAPVALEAAAAEATAAVAALLLHNSSGLQRLLLAIGLNNTGCSFLCAPPPPCGRLPWVILCQPGRGPLRCLALAHANWSCLHQIGDGLQLLHTVSKLQDSPFLHLPDIEKLQSCVLCKSLLASRPATFFGSERTSPLCNRKVDSSSTPVHCMPNGESSEKTPRHISLWVPGNDPSSSSFEERDPRVLHKPNQGESPALQGDAVVVPASVLTLLPSGLELRLLQPDGKPLGFSCSSDGEAYAASGCPSEAGSLLSGLLCCLATTPGSCWAPSPTCATSPMSVRKNVSLKGSQIGLNSSAQCAKPQLAPLRHFPKG
eukprot:CAMPEP_0171118008 /NCGR_PEP_ID=MMETSP0766_2-20121228/93787_1 /TAXON_ID=439317 /ORGANISM="Gambierdiscus australes, Strain CAWD 149" /LENGTH=343 /DNA_ID=CAMNT_0011580561 /DNA_START=226 /DNA_END=1259 /DNA_ORIENTATION=+